MQLKKTPTWQIVLAVISGLATAAAVIATTWLVTQPPYRPMEDPFTHCGGRAEDTSMTLQDEARTLVFKRPAPATVECVMDRLRAPRMVTSQMNTGIPADGYPEAKWGKYRALWTYGLETGLLARIELVD